MNQMNISLFCLNTINYSGNAREIQGKNMCVKEWRLPMAAKIQKIVKSGNSLVLGFLEKDNGTL